MTPSRKPVGAVLVVAAAALWGCWSICFRAAEKASPLPLSAASESAVVFIVMLVTMLPLALIARRRQEAAVPTTTKRQASSWALLFSLGVTDAGNALAFFAAMQATTVAVAVLTHYLTPLLVAALAPVFLGERHRASTFVALGLALFGLVLLLRPWTDIEASDLRGAGLGALSAVFYAANVFIGKRLFNHFNVVEIAAWPRLAAVIVLCGVVAVDGSFVFDSKVIVILVAGGIVCGSLPTVLFYAGLARIAASQASVLTLVEPLVAVCIGIVVWHEPLHPLGVVGAACVLGGAFLITRAAR